MSSFETAIDLLLENIGFCWLPDFIIAHLVAEKSLHRLAIKGSSLRPLICYVVKPKPDSCGPGTNLLYQTLIQQSAFNTSFQE